MNIQVEIKGLGDFRRAIAIEPILAVQEISTAVQKSLIVIQNSAMKEAPVNKQTGDGNLRQSIRSRMTSRLTGEVQAFASYASAVETGTRPHIIRAVNKKVLANKRTGQFFGKIVHHPGTRANPFMDRAVEASKPKIAQFFKTGVDNVLKTLHA